MFAAVHIASSSFCIRVSTLEERNNDENNNTDNHNSKRQQRQWQRFDFHVHRSYF